MGYTELWLVSAKCLWQSGQADSSRPGLGCLRVFGDLITCDVNYVNCVPLDTTLCTVAIFTTVPQLYLGAEDGWGDEMQILGDQL